MGHRKPEYSKFKNNKIKDEIKKLGKHSKATKIKRADKEEAETEDAVFFVRAQPKLTSRKMNKCG